MSAPQCPRACPWLIAAILILPTAAAVRAEENVIDNRMRQDITFLASDQCEGRGVNTRGINLAADYIANEFHKAGLKPAMPDGSYFQPFTMPSGGAKLGSPNALVLTNAKGAATEFTFDTDFRPLGLSSAGRITAPLVFVGYGVTAPNLHYDDYAGMDVAGKIVVVLRRAPGASMEKQPGHKPFDGNLENYHSALVTKLVNADLHKAAAVLFVSTADQVKDGDELLSFTATSEGGAATAKLPALHVTRATLERIVSAALRSTLAQLEDAIDREQKPHSAVLPGCTAALEINVEHPSVTVKNIVGVVEGSGPLADETVVLGAHYDHLGYGDRGTLARTKARAIHHGADDNASGDTVLMELARRFGALQGHPGRRLVFIAFSGEEAGLLGSEYYCKTPLFPLANTVAMLNMDMVGRLRTDNDAHKDKLIVYGSGTAKSFGELVDNVNHKYDMKIQKVAGANMIGERSSSDHASFYAKQIPVLFLFTGNHGDYHKPTDTSDKINVAGMHRLADFSADITNELVTTAARPAYVKVTVPAPAHAMSPGGMPRLGIRPSYGDEGTGVLLDGVSDGGPAAKAGLKEGDRLIELNGETVKDLDAYMVLLTRQKRGQPVKVVVLRAGKRLTLLVTPQ